MGEPVVVRVKVRCRWWGCEVVHSIGLLERDQRYILYMYMIYMWCMSCALHVLPGYMYM